MNRFFPPPPPPLLRFVVQLLSHVQLFATPRTAAHQTPLSFTVSWSLLKLMSIELVMPSNHLILSSPSPALNLSQHQDIVRGLFLCSILKSRDFTLPTKVHLVKAMVFQ